MNKQKESREPVYGDLFFSQTNRFLSEFLILQAGKSEHTRKQYRIGLREFYDYVVLRNIAPLKFCFKDISYQFLLEYSQYLQHEKSFTPATVNIRMTAIREYLKYVSNGNTELLQYFLIAKRVPCLTVPKTIRTIVDSDSLAVLLDSPKHTRIGNRDQFILIVLYDAAIRVDELVNITLGDITVENNGRVNILIHGKGRKERCVTLSSNASSHAQAYFAAYHKQPWDPGTPMIFTVLHGQKHQMSTRNVERIVSKYGEIAKESSPSAPDRIYPHMMRRTRATNLFRAGVSLEEVSALLGHAQMETTRTHYAYLSDEQKKKMMEKAVGEEPDLKKNWADNVDEIRSRFGLA